MTPQDRDKQTGQTGKVENDHNKAGDTQPTQKNEPRRTPQSRHDRDTHLGSDNQNQSRRGGAGSGQR